MLLSWSLAGWLLVSGARVAEAQNVVDMLLGQSQSSPQLEIKTPEAKLLAESQERLKQANQSLEAFRKRNKERLVVWEKETQASRKLINDFQVRVEDSDWRNARNLMQLRASLIAAAEQNINVLAQLQAAYASREQNLLSLRDTLQNYVKTRKTIEQVLKTHYIVPKLRDKLAADLKAILKKVAESKKARKEAKEELQQLTGAYENNQKQLDQARRQLVQMLTHPNGRTRPPARRKATVKATPSLKTPDRPKPTTRAPVPSPKTTTTHPTTSRQAKTAKRAPAKPAPRGVILPGIPVQPGTADANGKAPASRPVVRIPTEEEVQKSRELRYMRQLQSTVNKLTFDLYRLRSLWYRIRQRDEGVEQDVLTWKIRLFGLLAKEMEKALSQMVSYSRTGLWFRRKLEWNRPMFKAVWKRSVEIVKLAPKQSNGVWTRLKEGWDSLDQAGTIFMLLLSLSGIFFLLNFTRTTRARLEHSMEGLSAKVEGSSATKVFWLTILLLFRSVYTLLPFVGGLLVVGVLLWALELPGSWQAMVWGLGASWLGLLAFYMLSRQLFSANADTRLLRNVDDEGAQKFRRILLIATAIAFVYLPVVFAGDLLGYPSAFLHLLRVMFYGVLVLCLSLLLLSQDVILNMIPSDSVLGRAAVLMIYRFYPVFFLLTVGLFGIYAYGYVNFATYLAWGLVLSIVVVLIALALYRLFWTFGLVFFGFSRESQGIVKIEKKWARNLLRLGRFLSGIILSLVSLSLLLEIWGVAGGVKTVVKLFNTPFLQIKDTQLTAVSLMKFAISLTVALFASRWLKAKSTKYVYPALRLSRSNQHAVNTVLVYSILIMGFLFGLQWMGVGLGVLTVFAGIIGIGVGFGLQNIASNFISGLMITFGKPIKVGDLIEVGSMMGEVKEISARSTTIETYDYRIVLIPNSEILTTKVINWSLGQPFIMAKLGVGVAYGSDVQLVLKTLREVALAHPKVLQEPKPALRFGDFGSSSLDFALWVAVVNPLDRFEVLSDLRVEVDRRFRELGITIAFPQQDIHLDSELQDALVQSLKPQGSVHLPTALKPTEDKSNA